MTTRSRLILAFAAVLLGLLYVLPIWRITLEAPQYPEGIGMLIWVDTVTGASAHDLNSINKLNHYIGMKEIVPEAIPELTITPWVFGFLILLGLGAAATGKRWLLYTWVGVFVVVGVAGMVDFYLWGYDYGHDLDPEAIIQVPGMTYQPPLIGSKQLLNITAHSWPASGMIAALVSLLMGFVVAFTEWRRKRRARRAAPAATPAVAVLAAAALLAGCQVEPQPIRYGEDVGEHCRMTISDARFGTELLTTTGKAYTFDSVECLAGYVLAHPDAADEAHSLWVTSYDDPGTLVPLAESFFVHAPDLRSPMGQGLAAFGPGTTEADALAAFDDAEVLAWDDVLALVERASPAASHAMPDSERRDAPR
jgi:copper chaperone NosL